MSLRPLSDSVAIIPIEDPDITPSGLWVPEQAKQRADQGIIKYRGSDVKHLLVGMHVLFSPYSGTKISHAEEGQLYIMPESAVLALISDDPPIQLFDFLTIERLVYARLSEAQSKESPLEIEAFADDILSRLRSLPISEGFEF